MYPHSGGGFQTVDQSAGGGDGMSEKEKARPAGSAAEQAGQGNHWESGIPCNQYNPHGGGRQFEIADLLSHGPKNGLRLYELVSLTGWTGRAVRRMIQAERLGGVPILSDNEHGYFLPSSGEDRAACVRSLRGRAQEILDVANAIEAADVES